MEFKIEKSDLVSVLIKTQSIVEKRNTMPILVNILLQAENEKLKVFATDLEVSLTDECNIKVKTPGKVAVDAKHLFNIVKEMNEDWIELKKKENNWLEIKQNKAVYNIVGIAPEEFPIFPSYATKDFVKINADVLRDMIDKTIYSVSNDETRYHLNGVYFEQVKEKAAIKYRMVATDGHRLSIVERVIEGTSELTMTGGVIIPRKGLYEIKKALEAIKGEMVEVAIEGPQLIFKHGPTLLMVRLIEGRYPNYQQFVPQKLKNTAQASREVLMASLKRVSLLSNQKSKGVTLALSKGALKITSNNPELGDAKEELEIDYTGDEFKIGFNAKYIIDILNSIEDDDVKLELNDQLSPGIIRPESDLHYTCVVMPMRI
jgi:DNA polymerase-3 subunit beta